MSATVGVLLLNLGGPDRLESVEPFLRNLFSDREIVRLPGGAALQPFLARLLARARAPKVRAQYARIGGGSPIRAITERQARGLERVLGAGDRSAVTGAGASDSGAPPAGVSTAEASRPRFEVGVAMRYWHPTTEEALDSMVARGVRRIVGLSLYPQYSSASTGSSVHALERAVAARGPVELTVIDRYPDDPRYLDAVAAKVRAAFARVPEPLRGECVVVFSAHALPQELVDAGDPYLGEIERTRAGVVARLGFRAEHRLAFQSRVGPIRWIGPGTDETLDALGREGRRAVVVVPIAFVSDHVETLFELDLLLAERARAAGVEHYVRAESLNDDPVFLEALAGLVRRHVEATTPNRGDSTD